jgi:hypothetical protein
MFQYQIIFFLVDGLLEPGRVLRIGHRFSRRRLRVCRETVSMRAGLPDLSWHNEPKLRKLHQNGHKNTNWS